MTTSPEDLYNALLTTGRLPQLRRLTYRCDTNRCLLLDVVDTPLGVLLHQKRFKYSEVENLARSNAAGRERNTFDGDRKWMPRTYFLQSSALAYPDDRPAMSQDVSCDHVLAYQLTASDFRDDWQAGRAEIRVRVDGSRYAVR
ncbi:hypothetical protein ACFWDA_17085 [Rhodococcus zopfii]|uniref:hypothetical protein n=1 Tax=Rhodococcus zopfii TaxID=43772 RepID=UPI0036489874